MDTLHAYSELDFDNLPNPEDLLAEQGEFALVGVYCAVSKAFMTISEVVTAGILKYPRTSRGVIEREGMFEDWLNRCDEYLPEWYNQYNRINQRWIIQSNKDIS